MSTESASSGPGNWKKYCIVPFCTNTSRTTPNKKYFSVPKNEKIRKVWCSAIKRDEKKNIKLSSISTLYVCEDHFNLEQDLDNYYEHKLMNVRPRLKRGIIPHLFDCQKPSTSTTTVERKDVLERQRQQLVKDILKEYEESQHAKAALSSATSKSQIMDAEKSQTASTSTDTSVGKVRDMCVQVNMRPHYRSKGVNTKLLVTNQATSPMKILTTDSPVLPIKIPPQRKQVHVFVPISKESSSSQT